jgi:hypothetical protein
LETGWHPDCIVSQPVASPAPNCWWSHKPRRSAPFSGSCIGLHSRNANVRRGYRLLSPGPVFDSRFLHLRRGGERLQGSPLWRSRLQHRRCWLQLQQKKRPRLVGMPGRIAALLTVSGQQWPQHSLFLILILRIRNADAVRPKRTAQDKGAGAGSVRGVADLRRSIPRYRGQGKQVVGSALRKLRSGRICPQSRRCQHIHPGVAPPPRFGLAPPQGQANGQDAGAVFRQRRE